MITLEEFLGNLKNRVESEMQIVDQSQQGVVSGSSLTLRRTYFSLRLGASIVTDQVVVQNVDNATIDDIQKLGKASFKSARKLSKLPVPVGFQRAYIVASCVLTSRPSPDLVKYVCSPPRKHFGWLELPVVYDLGTGEIHYFKGTLAWGSFGWSLARKLISDTLAGEATESEIRLGNFDEQKYDNRRIKDPIWYVLAIVFGGMALGGYVVSGMVNIPVGGGLMLGAFLGAGLTMAVYKLSDRWLRRRNSR